MFTMLQINPVTRTVMSLWRSKTDIGGSIFDLATSYDLTFVNRLEYREDNELRRRFYQSRGESSGQSSSDINLNSEQSASWGAAAAEDEKPFPH